MCTVPTAQAGALIGAATGLRGVRVWSHEESPYRPLLGLRGSTGATRTVNSVTAVLGSRGATLVATAGEDSTVRLWEPRISLKEWPPSQSRSISGLTRAERGPHRRLFAFGDGHSAMLYSITPDDDVHMWNQATGEHLRTWRLGENQADVCCLIPQDGRPPFLVVPDILGALTMSQLGTGWPLWTQNFEAREDRLHEPVADIQLVTADSHITGLLTVGENGVIRIWDPRTGVRIHPAKKPGVDIGGSCSVVGPGGAGYVAAGGLDGIVRVWQLTGTKPLWRLEGHSGPVRTVFAASLDGDVPMLGSISGDNQLRVWNLETGQLHWQVERVDRWATIACPMRGAHGRPLVATGGLDRVVRIWDLGTGIAMEIPVRHEIASMAAARSRLFLGLEDGVMAVDVDESEHSVQLATRNR